MSHLTDLCSQSQGYRCGFCGLCRLVGHLGPPLECWAVHGSRRQTATDSKRPILSSLMRAKCRYIVQTSSHVSLGRCSYHLTVPRRRHTIAEYDEQSPHDMAFGPNRDLRARSTFAGGQSPKCSATD